MNKDNILAVADAIEKHSIPGLGFNMDRYVSRADNYLVDKTGNHCGTVACIAGWSRALLQGSVIPAEAPTAKDFDHRPEAEWLDLDRRDADELFYPSAYTSDDDRDLKDITPAQAVVVLRHLAETGEVDWTVADGIEP